MSLGEFLWFVVGWWAGATALWRYRPMCRREHVEPEAEPEAES